VDAEIIEHAAHLLTRAPARCMRADVLQRRVQADLRREVPYPRFVDAVRRSPGRFAVLPCPLAVAEQPGWGAEEASVYTAALSAAGASGAPTVALASPLPPADCPSARDPGDALRGDLLTDLHATLADLLQAAGEDPLLRDAVGDALSGLDAVRIPARQEARRSSTLHHCSSESSASTTKPVAAAAARSSAASSARMPARIAQPPGTRAR
jgi:hypothetical protein